MRRLLVSLVTITLLSTPARAADPWRLAGWNARAVVEIGKASAEPGCDVCGVKVLCQGRAKADGSDYRVVDGAGKALPFQLCFHDANRYSLISFKCDNAKGKYFIYFDNPKATRAAEQVADNPAPGSGRRRAPGRRSSASSCRRSSDPRGTIRARFRNWRS